MLAIALILVLRSADLMLQIFAIHCPEDSLVNYASKVIGGLRSAFEIRLNANR